MTTTITELERWIKNGIAADAIGMILLQNRASFDEYPVYVRKDQSIHGQANHYQRSWTDNVLEVFDFSEDIERQLEQSNALRV